MRCKRDVPSISSKRSCSLDVSSLFVDPSSFLMCFCQVIGKFPAQELANIDSNILQRLTNDLNVDVRQAATRVIGKQITAIGAPTDDLAFCTVPLILSM